MKKIPKIAFQRRLVPLSGGVLGALMLSQAIYWSERTKDPDGWFWKTQAQWERETGMGRREQEKARDGLRQTQFWEEKLRGIPGKMNFRVNLDLLEADLLGGCEQASMAESAKLVGQKTPNKKGKKRQTCAADSAIHITESTSETTTEITAKSTHTPSARVCDGPLSPNPESETTPTSDTSATLTENPAVQGGQGALVDPVEAVFQSAVQSGQEIRNPAAYRAALVRAAARGELVAPIPIGNVPSPADIRHERRRAQAIQWAQEMTAWDGYAEAYEQRYGVRPVKNAHTERHIAQLVTRLGDEVGQVAAWYVTHNGAFYVRAKHPTDLLLRDAEGLRTEWARGSQVTDQDARQTDRRQATMNAFSPLLEEAEREAKERGK